MRVYVLGSGSSGNALLVEDEASRVLVDCGLGPRAAVNRLRALGADLFPRGVDAIVVTHEHHDHIAHLESHARSLRAPVYLHHGIDARRVRSRYEVREYAPGKAFAAGALSIEALAVPHDAGQVALRVSSARYTFGHVTDVGHVPRDLAPFLGACDMALVEANYCPELLHLGPYPPRLKRRVSGGMGHLANHEAGELAAALRTSRVRKLLLGHVSRANNTPDRALAAVRARAGALAVEVVEHGVPARFELTDLPPFAAGEGRFRRPVSRQLVFDF